MYNSKNIPFYFLSAVVIWVLMSGDVFGAGMKVCHVVNDTHAECMVYVQGYRNSDCRLHSNAMMTVPIPEGISNPILIVETSGSRYSEMRYFKWNSIPHIKDITEFANQDVPGVKMFIMSKQLLASRPTKIIRPTKAPGDRLIRYSIMSLNG